MEGTQYLATDTSAVRTADPMTQFKLDSAVVDSFLEEDEIDLAEFDLLQQKEKEAEAAKSKQDEKPKYFPLTTQAEFDAYKKEANIVAVAYPIGKFAPPDGKDLPITYLEHMYKTNQDLATLPDYSQGSDPKFNFPLFTHKALAVSGYEKSVVVFWGEELPWVLQLNEPCPKELMIRHVGWMAIMDKGFARFVWMRKSEHHPVMLVKLNEDMEKALYESIPYDIITHDTVRNQVRINNLNINYKNFGGDRTINMVPADILNQKKLTRKRSNKDAPEPDVTSAPDPIVAGVAKGKPKKPLDPASIMKLPKSEVFEDLWRHGKKGAIHILQGRQLEWGAKKYLGVDEYSDVGTEFVSKLTGRDIGGVMEIDDMFGLQATNTANNNFLAKDDEVEFDSDYDDLEPEMQKKMIKAHSMQMKKAKERKAAESLRRDKYGGMDLALVQKDKEAAKGKLLSCFYQWMKHGFHRMPGGAIPATAWESDKDKKSLLISQIVMLSSGKIVPNETITAAIDEVSKAQAQKLAEYKPDLRWCHKATYVLVNDTAKAEPKKGKKAAAPAAPAPVVKKQEIGKKVSKTTKPTKQHLQKMPGKPKRKEYDDDPELDDEDDGDYEDAAEDEDEDGDDDDVEVDDEDDDGEGSGEDDDEGGGDDDDEEGLAFKKAFLDTKTASGGAATKKKPSAPAPSTKPSAPKAVAKASAPPTAAVAKAAKPAAEADDADKKKDNKGAATANRIRLLEDELKEATTQLKVSEGNIKFVLELHEGSKKKLVVAKGVVKKAETDADKAKESLQVIETAISKEMAALTQARSDKAALEKKITKAKTVIAALRKPVSIASVAAASAPAAAAVPAPAAAAPAPVEGAKKRKQPEPDSADKPKVRAPPAFGAPESSEPQINIEFTIDEKLRTFIMDEVHGALCQGMTVKEVGNKIKALEDAKLKEKGIKRTDAAMAGPLLLMPPSSNVTVEAFLDSNCSRVFRGPAQYVLAYDPQFLPLGNKMRTAGNNAYELFRKYCVAKGEELCSDEWKDLIVYYHPNFIHEENRAARLEELKYKLVFLRLKYEEMLANFERNRLKRLAKESAMGDGDGEANEEDGGAAGAADDGGSDPVPAATRVEDDDRFF